MRTVKDLSGRTTDRLEGRLSELANRGPGITVWDMSLCMGFTSYANGTRQFFRYPSAQAHPDCKVPREIPDAEFKKFIEFHGGLK